MKKTIALVVATLFLNLMVCPLAYAQEEAVTVMTLADGTQVNMTAAQLAGLKAQSGIIVSTTPTVAAAEVAIPLPEALGGGFLVGEPAAIAAGMNTVGITTAATVASVAGATATAGTMVAGAAAGALVAGGVGAGTIGAGIAAAAAAAGIAAAAGGGGVTAAHH